LERLAEGPVIGDGGFVFQLEKRGYVKVSLFSTSVSTLRYLNSVRRRRNSRVFLAEV
jgi:hypothetical protein